MVLNEAALFCFDFNYFQESYRAEYCGSARFRHCFVIRLVFCNPENSCARNECVQPQHLFVCVLFSYSEKENVLSLLGSVPLVRSS